MNKYDNLIEEIPAEFYYKQPFKKPKDYFWLIIGILTPFAIGAIIFFIWYLNLIINLPLPI